MTLKIKKQEIFWPKHLDKIIYLPIKIDLQGSFCGLRIRRDRIQICDTEKNVPHLENGCVNKDPCEYSVLKRIIILFLFSPYFPAMCIQWNIYGCKYIGSDIHVPLVAGMNVIVTCINWFGYCFLYS